MVKILVIRNGPVVLLSHMLKHLAADGTHITVLTHRHAVESVEALQGVDAVEAYDAPDIFQWRRLPAGQRKRLRGAGFDEVVFLINRDQKTGFENLLHLALKLVRPGGRMVGMTTTGERRLFEAPAAARCLRRHRLQKLLAGLVCALLLAGLAPVACLFGIRYLARGHATRA